MAFRIALDAGHGLKTLGKRCNKKIDPKETREWWLNNRIAVYMEEYLKPYDAEVLRVDDRTGAKDISLSKRCKAANDFKADIYFSVHHNAGIKRGSGGGIVAYVWKKANAELLAWQKIVYNNLIAETGLKGNRANPLGKANFYVLVNTKAQAILVEHGFMDSTTDTPVILTDEFARQCAMANVKSLVEIGDLKKKETAAFTPYKVKVTNPPVNVRKEPKANAPIVGKVSKEGVFTIVEEAAPSGTKYGWGKLKSGAGWITLSPSFVKKV